MEGTNRRAEALALLGLARRAGALVLGTEATRECLRSGKAELVILAEDGSETQRRKVLPLAEAREVPLVFLGGRVELGATLGAGPLSAVAVTGASLARELKERLQQEARTGGGSAQRR